MLKANPQYASQLNALENKLAEFISGQTETGMSPAVEQAIYARSQSKQDAESKRVADEAISRAARMGFTMPSGALMGSMQKARQAAADNNAAIASRDFFICTPSPDRPIPVWGPPHPRDHTHSAS